MDDDSRAVWVNFCGSIDQLQLNELSLQGLCRAAAKHFDIGSELQFVADVEGEPDVIAVTSDEDVKRLARQRKPLRVIITDKGLSDLEKRMWELRQHQWGFFQDELARVKKQQITLRNEMRQLRTAMESTVKREVDLTGELLNERRLREKSDQELVERCEELGGELRREQRARDATEASLRKDLEDARQAALKFDAGSQRRDSELQGEVQLKAQEMGKLTEALLSEWANSHTDIRTKLEFVCTNVERGAQDAERQSQALRQEASAREAFEQFIGEKVHSVEVTLGKFQGVSADLDRRIGSVLQEAQEARSRETSERKAGQEELRLSVVELREDAEAQKAREITTLTLASPGVVAARPVLQSTTLSSSTATLPARHPSPGPGTRASATSPGAVQRALTPPPCAIAAVMSPQTGHPGQLAPQVVRRSTPTGAIITSAGFARS